MTKILIVEDEEKLARFVELELTHEGYSVMKAADGLSAVELFEQNSFDVILLDIMLPVLSGLEVLRRIRKTSAVPVILLTARDAVSDKVSGLDAGADDYLTKPFAIEELFARIRAVVRKNVVLIDKNVDEIVIGDICLHISHRTVTCNGQEIDLTKREFDLLHTLMENKNIVLSRDSLLQLVWDYDYAGETNVVDVYIRYLRNKIDLPYDLKFIHTVRGVGYVIKT